MLPASLSDPQWCWSFHQQAPEGSPQGQHHWWAPSGSSFISVYKVVTANSISPPLHNHTVTGQNNSYAKAWQCFILSLHYFPEKWVSSLSILQRSAIRAWVFFKYHISWILDTLMWLNLLWSLSSLTRQAEASPSSTLIRYSTESPKNLSWFFRQDYSHLWCFLVFWFDKMYQALWSLETGTNTSHVF